MNLPNTLTISRIFLIPLLVVVLLTKFEGHMIFGVRNELVGAMIFSIASLTDWADGYLARRRHEITPLGQIIDPLADKLLTGAAFISLVSLDLAPAWMVAIIIGREFIVTGLRNLAYARGIVIPASPLGKVKMVSQVVAILALILSDIFTFSIPIGSYAVTAVTIGHAALWLAVATALVSGADYFRRFSVFPVAR